MKVCTRCLYRNDNTATFCASCGTFLEWSSDRAPTPDDAVVDTPVVPATPRRKAAAARPRRVAASSRPGRSTPTPPEDAPIAEDGPPLDPEAAALALAAQRLRWRVDENRRRRAGMDPRQEPAWLHDGPAVARRRRIPPPATSPGPAAPAPPADDDLLVEPTDDEAVEVGPEQPHPLQPTEEVQHHVPHQETVEEDLTRHPGDVTCPRCQTPNAPSRYFCRRCGTPLHGEANSAVPAAPVQAVRLSWWRRLWRRLLWWRRQQDVPATPAPARREWTARAWSAAPIVVVLGLVAGALGPWRAGIGDRLESVRKRVSPQYDHVYPAKVSASSALPDHPAEAAVDRAPNTYWAEGAGTQGEGEQLTFEFDRPIDLGRIGFYNGAQAKPQDFLSEPRLRDVELTFDVGPPVRITLKDRDAFQNYGVDAKGVTQVQLRILSVFPSPQGGTDASLGEVEFFTRG